MSDFWQPAATERLLEMWRDGKRIRDIALELGCTRNAVIGKAHRCGLSHPSNRIYKPWILDREARLQMCHAQGMTIKEMAEQLGLGWWQIHRKLVQLGLARITRERNAEATAARREARLAAGLRVKEPRVRTKRPSKPQGYRWTCEESDRATGLMDLMPWQCRWPIDDEQPCQLFCGKQVAGGHSYCQYHYDMSCIMEWRAP